MNEEQCLPCAVDQGLEDGVLYETGCGSVRLCLCEAEDGHWKLALRAPAVSGRVQLELKPEAAAGLSWCFAEAERFMDEERCRRRTGGPVPPRRCVSSSGDLSRRWPEGAARLPLIAKALPNSVFWDMLEVAHFVYGRRHRWAWFGRSGMAAGFASRRLLEWLYAPLG